MNMAMAMFECILRAGNRFAAVDNLCGCTVIAKNGFAPIIGELLGNEGWGNNVYLVGAYG